MYVCMCVCVGGGGGVPCVVVVCNCWVFVAGCLLLVGLVSLRLRDVTICDCGLDTCTDLPINL